MASKKRRSDRRGSKTTTVVKTPAIPKAPKGNGKQKSTAKEKVDRAAIMAKYKPRTSGTSLSSNTLVLPGEHGALTEKQRSVAVNDNELPPCVGNPGAPCPHPTQPMMIQGYDDKMRCPSCNRIHVELVYEEAGQSDPNTAPKFVNPRLNKKATTEAQRRKQEIMRKCAPRDGWTTPPQIRAAPGDLVDMRGRRFNAAGQVVEPEKKEAESDEERRKRILEKYGQRTGGSALK